MGNVFLKLGWLFALLLLVSLEVRAQEEKPDILWLTNGEKLEGKVIIPSHGDELTLIQILTGDTLVIKRQDIDRMEQYVAYTPQDIRKQQSDQRLALFNTKKNYGILQSMAGSGDIGLLFGAGIRAGYRFSVGLELGLAAHYYGIDIDQGWGEGIFPLGLDARFPILKSKSGRFVALLQLNTGMTFSDPYDVYSKKYNEVTFRGDGFFYQTGLALRANISRHMGLIFDICYLNVTSPKHSSKTKSVLGRDQEFGLLASVGLNF
jgi:hypothetical protein